MPGYLNPEDEALFNSQANALRATYGRQLAKNTYAQSVLGQNHDVGRERLTQSWDARRSALPGSYARGGLLHSGIYQNGLQAYAQQRMNAFGDLDRNYYQQLGGLNQNLMDYESNLNSGLDLVESQRQARRANLASQLRGIM